MATKPLPPPRGFTRLAQRGETKVRYVYPFADSRLGREAEAVHAWFLESEERRFRSSKLNKLIHRKTKEIIRDHSLILSDCKTRSERSRFIRRARSAALYRMSLLHPLFINRDPLHQVLEHLVHRNRYFMKVDIADAFGSVYPGVHARFPVVTKRVRKDLLEFEDLEWTGWPFFHSNQGGLIQGAPASPHIFDSYCRETGFDKMLRDYAAKYGFVVTRYVDDVVFSCSRPIGRKTFQTLRNMFRHYGFEVNERKCGRFDTHKKPLEFLGVTLYRDKVRPKPAFFNRMSALGVVNEGHLSWIYRVEELNEINLIMQSLIRAELSGGY